MPSETHSHLDGLDEATVLLVVAAVLGHDDLRPETLLAEAGVDDELALLHLWSDVVEELAERSVAEIDVDDLDVVTIGDFCRRVLDVAAAPDGSRLD